MPKARTYEAPIVTTSESLDSMAMLDALNELYDRLKQAEAEIEALKRAARHRKG